MKNLESIIRRYLNGAIIYTALLFLVGLFFFIFPETSLSIIRWILALSLIVAGSAMILADLSRRSFVTLFTGPIAGVLALVIGMLIAIRPEVLNIVPIILGVYIIITSAFSLRLTVSLHSSTTPGFVISTLTSIISIICGIVLVSNPNESFIALGAFTGIILMLHAVSSFVDLVIFRTNLKSIAKYLKKKSA